MPFPLPAWQAPGQLWPDTGLSSMLAFRVLLPTRWVVPTQELGMPTVLKLVPLPGKIK